MDTVAVVLLGLGLFLPLGFGMLGGAYYSGWEWIIEFVLGIQIAVTILVVAALRLLRSGSPTVAIATGAVGLVDAVGYLSVFLCGDITDPATLVELGAYVGPPVLVRLCGCVLAILAGLCALIASRRRGMSLVLSLGRAFPASLVITVGQAAAISLLFVIKGVADHTRFPEESVMSLLAQNWPTAFRARMATFVDSDSEVVGLTAWCLAIALLVLGVAALIIMRRPVSAGATRTVCWALTALTLGSMLAHWGLWSDWYGEVRMVDVVPLILQLAIYVALALPCLTGAYQRQIRERAGGTLPGVSPGAVRAG